MARRKARTKQLLTEGDSVTLPKAQQRAVIALVAQREQIMSEGSRALTEISEALRELASIYAMKAGLSDDALYDFEQRGEAIVLVRQKDEETKGQGDKEAEGQGDEGTGGKENGD